MMQLRLVDDLPSARTAGVNMEWTADLHSQRRTCPDVQHRRAWMCMEYAIDDLGDLVLDSCKHILVSRPATGQCLFRGCGHRQPPLSVLFPETVHEVVPGQASGQKRNMTTQKKATALVRSAFSGPLIIGTPCLTGRLAERNDPILPEYKCYPARQMSELTGKRPRNVTQGQE